MTITPEMREVSAADQIRRSLRNLAIATAILYAVLIAGGIYVYSSGQNTNRAICAYRNDLTAQVLASTKFLKDHPAGIPGIPTSVILQGIDRQQHAILALKDLKCDKSAPIKAPEPTPDAP